MAPPWSPARIIRAGDISGNGEDHGPVGRTAGQAKQALALSAANPHDDTGCRVRGKRCRRFEVYGVRHRTLRFGAEEVLPTAHTDARRALHRLLAVDHHPRMIAGGFRSSLHSNDRSGQSFQGSRLESSLPACRQRQRQRLFTYGASGKHALSTGSMLPKGIGRRISLPCRVNVRTMPPRRGSK